MPADLTQLLISAATGGVAAVAAIRFLGEKSVEHLFDRRLEAFKDTLSRDSALLLGDAESDRTYRFEARQRLYKAVGPLRFQLIQSAIYFRDRITNIAEYRYTLANKGYFYRSTVYRLARLIALLELIENEMAYFDFSVDDSMLRIVRFRAMVFQAMSGSDFLLDHPGSDYSAERQHLFRDTLPVLAVSMMVAGTTAPRAARIDEFNVLLAQGGGYMEPLASQMAQLDTTKTPVMWLRLSAVAVICDALLQSESALAEALGAKPFSLEPLVDASADPFIIANRDRYLAEFNGLAAALK